MQGCDVRLVYACLCLSRLPSETSTMAHTHTHTHTHIHMYYKRTSCSLLGKQPSLVSHRFQVARLLERELGITASPHMPLSTIAVNSTAKPGNVFGSRRHLGLATVVYPRPETISMYRLEFPEHVSANKSIFACWC